MRIDESLSLVACGGILALAALVLAHRDRNPLAVPLGLLCIDMSVWNFATWAFRYSGADAWHWLDVTFSPFTPPLTLHVVLVFVGRLPALRWLLVLSYALFGALSLSSAAAFLFPWARRWIESLGWSVAFLALWIPLLVLAGVLLVAHLRRQVRDDERMRTRLILASILVGGAFGSTEMWDDIVAMPALGHVGALIATVLNVMVVLRFRLLGSEWSARAAAYALALGATAVLGYVIVFRALATNTALLALTVVSISLALLAALGGVVRAYIRTTQRERQLAFLGSFSAQMAHDLKNPLAALKGALDYLVEEQARGRGAAQDDDDFLELARGQVARIEAVVTDYQQFGDQPAPREAIDVGELVEVAVGRATSATPEVVVQIDVEPGLPRCAIDDALITRVLDNIVQNAIEAMSASGTLSVAVRATRLDESTAAVAVIFGDTGEGMDARQQALAFEEFHSSKGSSGLGLAFVRRVVEAHDGEVRLSSTLGQGTMVELRLPVAATAEETKK